MGKTKATSTMQRSKLTQIQQSPRRQPPLTVLLIYPLTLILGSLYSVISPTARPSRSDPLTPGLASDINLSSPPGSTKAATSGHPTISSTGPVNYFAKKSNIFNVYFVKVGWVWLTLAFLVLLLTQPAFTSASTISSTLTTSDSGNISSKKNETSSSAASSTPSSSPSRPRRVLQAVIRYSIATAVWFLTTQWFFGPAVIDRTFTLTGGKCQAVQQEFASGAASQEGPVEELKIALSAAACRAAGGAWLGGHDVSGHVFMLVLATAFLAFEALGSSYLKPALEAGGDDNEKDIATFQEVSLIRKWSLRFVWAVTVLDWWMLLMTAIWFHTWLEKLSGLVIALSTIYVIYFLPRLIPQWRGIVGLPGL